MKVFILSLICILSFGISLFYIKNLLRNDSYVVHGPYVCDNKKITIMQDVSNDIFAGGTLTKNLYVSFDNNFFHYNISTTTYNNNSAYIDLNQDPVWNVLNDYGIGGSHLEELVSDNHMTDNDFKDFGKCFNIHIRKIYTDIAKRQRADGERFSFSIFSRVYNRVR